MRPAGGPFPGSPASPPAPGVWLCFAARTRAAVADRRVWWPPRARRPVPLPPPRGGGCSLLHLSLTGGPSGVSSELGRGAGGREGAGGGERRGPKFMLIRAEPASRLPSAAPAASSAGHSAGRSRCEAPGGRASELRGPRAAAGPGREGERRGRRGGRTAGGGPARGQVESRGPRWAAACRCGCAPSRRCSRGLRPRAPRSSRGPRRPVPPATASTRRDGARGCARRRTSKRGPRPAGSGRDGVREALPPAPTARGRRGLRAPEAERRPGAGAPRSGRLRGWRRKISRGGLARRLGPGSARGNLSSEVTFSSCAVCKLPAQRTRWRERREGRRREAHAGLPQACPPRGPPFSPVPHQVGDGAQRPAARPLPPSA